MKNVDKKRSQYFGISMPNKMYFEDEHSFWIGKLNFIKNKVSTM